MVRRACVLAAAAGPLPAAPAPAAAAARCLPRRRPALSLTVHEGAVDEPADVLSRLPQLQAGSGTAAGKISSSTRLQAQSDCGSPGQKDRD